MKTKIFNKQDIVALSTVEKGNYILTCEKSKAWMCSFNSQDLAKIVEVREDEVVVKRIDDSDQLDAFLKVEKLSAAEQEMFKQHAFNYENAVKKIDALKKENTIVVTDTYIKLVYDCYYFNHKKQEIKEAGARWDRVNKVWLIEADDELVESLSLYRKTLLKDLRTKNVAEEVVEEVVEEKTETTTTSIDNIAAFTKHNKHESVSDEEQLEAIAYCKENNISVDVFGDYHHEMMHEL